jgi:putative effector of murein hydrolase
VSSHGIGIARALQVDELADACSALVMGLNAIATAIMLWIYCHLLLWANGRNWFSDPDQVFFE